MITQTTIDRLDNIMKRMETKRIEKARAKSEANALAIAVAGRMQRTYKLILQMDARRK